MSRILRATLGVATALSLVTATAHAAAPAPAATPAAVLDAARRLTADPAVADLVARSKAEVVAALRSGAQVAPYAMPSPSEFMARIATASETPLTAAHPSDAALVARINALVAQPAYQRLIHAAPAALVSVSPQQIASGDQYLQATFLIHLLTAMPARWGLGSIVKVLTVVAGATALVAGAIACGATVVCAIATGAGAIALIGSTYLMVADETTHSLNIQQLSCGSATDCLVASRATSTSTIKGTSLIGGAGWTFMDAPANPSHTYGGGGDGWSYSQTASQGGVHEYSVSNWWDGGGQYDITECFPYVEVEVDVVWSDNTYSRDNTTASKPSNPSGQYC
jgi:hypothetical protein